jgi:hypothetical protein
MFNKGNGILQAVGRMNAIGATLSNIWTLTRTSVRALKKRKFPADQRLKNDLHVSTCRKK